MTNSAGIRWFRLLSIMCFLLGFEEVTPRAKAEDSGAWQLVDPWLRPRERLGMAYDSQRGVTVMFGGYVHYARTDVHLGDTWEYNGNRWVRKTTEGPSPRFWPAVAYDSRRGVTVLFGGGTYIGGRYTRYGDTWEWDGVRWSLTATEGPSARYRAAMAYDEHRGVMVLCGAEWSDDGTTWEWDGQAWASINTKTRPPGAYNPRMVYDSTRRVMVRVADYETWEFNGIEWVLRKGNGPPTRESAMAFDSARGETVMYNGDFPDGETWAWDGLDWTLVSEVGPGNIERFAMAFDSHHGVTVLFGGEGSPYIRDTTWEWDGKVWAERSRGPLGRSSPRMTYDAARRQTVLFGGFRYYDQHELHTFGWDGREWSLLSTSGPPPGTSHAMTYHARLEMPLLFRDTDTWAWDGSAWFVLDDAGPGPRHVPGMIYDDARDRVVLFGGSTQNSDNRWRPSGETWEWKEGVWTRENTRGPSDRYTPMVYDKARQVAVIFGGYTQRNGFDGETWEWNGRRWTLAATTGPAPRAYHQLVYDESRRVTVLYSGTARDGQHLSDMWEWDGLEWRERQVEAIAPRRNPAMAYDTDRKRIVLFGGYGEYGEYYGDTWEFDPCVGLTKLKARCKASGGGGGGGGEVTTIKVTVITTLPEGSTVPVDNTDLASNTTDRQRIPVNARGKAKHKWPDQHGEHAITLADCPRRTQTVTCDP